MIALGLMVVMLFAGASFAADQIRTRSKDQTKAQDQIRTQDPQKSQTKDQTQTRDRVKDGSCKTTK
jgi:hypothetical protein